MPNSTSSKRVPLIGAKKSTRDSRRKQLGLQAFEFERIEKQMFALANELFGRIIFFEIPS